MNQKQLLGQIRELIMAGGAALASFGIFAGVDWAPFAGAFVSVVAVIWAFRAKEGTERIYTLMRKALGASGSALTVYGMLTEAQGSAVVGATWTLLAMLSSWRANHPDPPKKPFPALMFLPCLAFLLPSCTISLGPDGRAMVTPDPETIIILADKASDRINDRFRE